MLFSSNTTSELCWSPCCVCEVVSCWVPGNSRVQVASVWGLRSVIGQFVETGKMALAGPGRHTSGRRSQWIHMIEGKTLSHELVFINCLAISISYGSVVQSLTLQRKSTGTYDDKVTWLLMPCPIIFAPRKVYDCSLFCLLIYSLSCCLPSLACQFNNMHLLPGKWYLILLMIFLLSLIICVSISSRASVFGIVFASLLDIW